MTKQLPFSRRPFRQSTPPSLTIALAALLAAACGPVAQSQSQPAAHVDGPTASVHPAATALMDAERMNASFAAIPAGVEDARAASADARAAEVATLRRAAERAYREEGATLREALLMNMMVPADAVGVIRSLTVLAEAQRTAAAGRWTLERSIALDRALAASPNRQGIIALSSAMAASRFAGERALTTRRMVWALDHSHRAGTQPSLSDASEQVSQMIAATRQAEDTKARASTGATVRDDHALLQALLLLPATDITTLTAWYSSDAGKAAKDRLVGGFQGANDRAGRAMLIDFLTQAGPEG
jgi:hypothetical protein